MITFFFVLTATMLIPTAIKFVGLVCHSSISLPPLFPTDFTPDSGLIFYPCLAFQVWFWTDKLGFIV